jgi:hypothetical protein
MKTSKTEYAGGVVKEKDIKQKTFKNLTSTPPADIFVKSIVAKEKRTLQVETFNHQGDAVPPQTIVKGTGPFLDIVKLNLVFWGNEWVNAGSPVSQITVQTAISSICSGAYMERAYQYANFGAVEIQDVINVTTPTPVAFTEGNVQQVIINALNSNLLRTPNDNSSYEQLYVVIMPTGSSSTTAGRNGFHSFFNWLNLNTNNNETVYYAWAQNNGTLNGITNIFSHELVESFTDPRGTYIQIAPSSTVNWNEIGDICSSSAFIDGVLVQSYWSQGDNACVIPFYGDDLRPREFPPAGASLQVIGIRLNYSKELHEYWIGELKGKASNGDIFQLFRIDAVGLIAKGTNSFFTIKSDGSQTPIILVNKFDHPFLSTQPDETKDDNLLSLPRF